MEDEVFIIESFSEKVELMRLYYKIIGDGKFVQAINHFKNGEGFGIDPVSCTFSQEYQPGEEGYFGESGVNFSLQPPMAEIEENAIVDYETFFKYLTEASENYLTRNPNDKDHVESCLTLIKQHFKIS
ncbi:ribonuclease toxin immunity protein CdiI [Bacillus sp. FSL W8-0848]|uniref:ribonuclease toxin immunity protein CdiI n=1 Tax=Bacillus sp. FSL W8-0848 TaxID=2954634 RepID=UPI0030FBAB1F